MQPEQGGNYWQKEGVSEQTNAPPIPQLEEKQPNNEQYDMPLTPVSWEASEYIDHDRDKLWFGGFALVTVILIAVSVFVVKNYFFTVLIVVMAAALIIYTRRPPQVTNYSLSEEGLMIGQKFHGFTEFRAFGVIQDGPLFSVRLLPTARFGQEMTIYFSENEGEQIVDILGSFLPMEELHLDTIDILLRRLRL